MSETFITAPKVTVVSRPTFIEPEHLRVEWEGVGKDGERLVEYAGRICYMSQHNPAKRTTATYLWNILQQRHGSVLEHANYSLLIEGISRSCSHEFVRHRAGFAYSQLSQRYVDESDTQFVIPPALLDAKWESVSHYPLLEEWKDEMVRLRTIYENTVSRLMQKYADIEDRTERRKRAREAARSVLPNSTETKIVVTANLRAWRTMLELRAGPGAEAEIRRLAFVIIDTLTEEAPAVFADVATGVTPAGTQFANFGHSKV